MNLEEAKLKLSKYGQEQILRYYDELSDDEKNALLDQIDKTDMEVLSAIEHKSELVKKGEITPLDAMEIDEITANYDTFKNTGVEAIKAGKVGAILLAGAMGTRLGSDNPKGMYNVGVNKELYIFECLINNLKKVVDKAEAWIPLFIMTSEKNYDDTREFLKEKNYNMKKFIKKYFLLLILCIILILISSLTEGFLVPSLLKLVIKLFI